MKEQIERGREAALALLKPSRADLARGLELHANSMVVESYGFAPRSVIRAAAMKPVIESGAPFEAILDTMDHEAMTRWATDPQERTDFEEAFDAAGVTCVFQNAGNSRELPQELIKRVAQFTYACEMAGDFCSRAYVPDDIERAWEDGRRCLYLGTNTTPLALRMRSAEEEVSHIEVFAKLGVRMMHFTYQRANLLGSGSGERNDAGLTDLGRRAVDEMNRVGVIVDVAHCGNRTSLEAARASAAPVVASHSACHAISGHYRAKTDETIRAIADTDGYVGVCWLPAFLGGSGDLLAVLDHIDYLVRHFGAERVAVGTDVLCFNERRQAEEKEKTPERYPSRGWWGGLWPGRGTKPSEGMTETQKASLAWTNWPLLTVGMAQRGHSDEAIRKVIGGNVMRVARAVWDARRRD